MHRRPSNNWLVDRPSTKNEASMKNDDGYTIAAIQYLLVLVFAKNILFDGILHVEKQKVVPDVPRI